MGNAGAQTGYAPVNGLKLYYEIHGVGEPLVLLHDGVGGIGMFGPNLAAFAEGRKVIAVELQAHGRTADVDRPLSFELMADDIAALLTYLEIPKVDLLGYSLGADVALQTTFRHPELVRKLVVLSTAFSRSGWFPEVRAGLDQLGPSTAEFMRHSPLFQLYPKVDWARLFAKLGELLRKDYDWSKDVAQMKAPTMLIFADADSVTPTHIVEFFRLLGGGLRDGGLDGSGRPQAQLAILPGQTHHTIGATPALAPTVIPFLEET